MRDKVSRNSQAKTPTVGIRLPRAMKQEVERVAAREHRSFNKQLVFFVDQGLQSDEAGGEA